MYHENVFKNYEKVFMAPRRYRQARNTAMETGPRRRSHQH